MGEDAATGYVFAGLSDVSSRLLRTGLSEYSRDALARAAEEEEQEKSDSVAFGGAFHTARVRSADSASARDLLVERARSRKELERVRAQLRRERQLRAVDANDHANALAALEARVSEEKAKRVAEYELVWLSTQQQLGAERQARALVEAELDVARQQLVRAGASQREREAEAGVTVAVAKQLSVWFRLMDENTGLVFFQNATTGRTAWELPEGGRAVDVQRNGAGLLAGRAGSESAGRAPFQAGGRARAYSSGSALFSTPARAVHVDDPSGINDEWHERIDPRSGSHYYENARTGTTTWELPGACARSARSGELKSTLVRTPGSGRHIGRRDAASLPLRTVRMYLSTPGPLGVQLGYDHEGDRAVVVGVRDDATSAVRVGDFLLAFRAKYSEIAEPFEAFAQLDSVGDGKLSASDLTRVFGDDDVARAESESVFELLTRSLDGRVTLREFKTMTRSLCHGAQMAALKSSLLSAAAQSLKEQQHPLVLEFGRPEDTGRRVRERSESPPHEGRRRRVIQSGGAAASSSPGGGSRKKAPALRSYAPVVVPPRAPFPCANNVLMIVRVELSNVTELRAADSTVAELSLSVTIGNTGELALKCEANEVYVEDDGSGTVEWAPRLAQLSQIRSAAIKARCAASEGGSFPALWPPVDAGAMLEALDAPLLIKIHNVETKQELFSVPTTLGWVWSSGSTRAVHATSKGGMKLKVYCSSITLGELLVLPSGDLSGGRVAGAVLAQTLFELYDQDGSDEVDPAEIENHLRQTLAAFVTVEGKDTAALMVEFETAAVVALAMSPDVRSDPSGPGAIAAIAKHVQEVIFEAADLDRGSSVSSDEFMRWYVPRHATCTAAWASASTVVPHHVWTALSAAIVSGETAP